MNTDEWLDPISYATTEYTIRNTMKGPWDSIAAGREKGHKTQKLEAIPRHVAVRVR